MYLPEHVKFIIKKLKDNGHEAYAVGGCVRDTMLGRTPGDWDITTSAKPEETKALFRRTFDTGIEHGTITVLLDHVGYEVTTYRIDGKYEDNRHPASVEFTPNLEEDLLRRDFTINAMAYNDEEGLVDIFGGVEDLNRGVIRCVGDANARFGEDALRILRAVRFSAQLGFEIEEDTKRGVRELAPTLRQISAERIQVEMVKLLVSPHPDFIHKAYELGVTAVVLPEWDEMMATTQENPHHKATVGGHTLEALMNVRADKKLRLTMLLHDCAKPKCKTVDGAGVAHFHKHNLEGEALAKRILKRWKMDNDTIKTVSQLIRVHDDRIVAQEVKVRRALNRMGGEMFPLYLEVAKADILSQSTYMQEEKLENLHQVEVLYKGILEKEQATALKDLKVTGNDLIQAGVPKGKRIGEVLQLLLEDVLEEPEHNNYEYLIQLAESYIER